MAEAEEETKKKKKSPTVLIAAVASLLLGGGSFYAVYSGKLLGEASGNKAEGETKTVADLPPVAYVPVEPLLVSLGRTDPPQHLRFEAHLEVEPAYSDEVAAVMPRIMDVLNSYLRAVEVNDLRDPAALIRLRVQMLRRIQMVTGEGRVRDLLVSKFLIS